MPPWRLRYGYRVGVGGVYCRSVEVPTSHAFIGWQCRSGKLASSKARVLSFGDYRGPPASRNAEAQRFFDQGLVFGWGFNFAEAVRSFRAASQLDPLCALCRWGLAWALGPSINHEMNAADVPVAVDAIAQARGLSVPGSRDRGLIDALAVRYSRRSGVDADRLASSYARAMQSLAERYAGDGDIAVLAAEPRVGGGALATAIAIATARQMHGDAVGVSRVPGLPSRSAAADDPRCGHCSRHRC